MFNSKTPAIRRGTLFKKKFQHKCLPVNIAKLLKTFSKKNLKTIANCCFCSSTNKDFFIQTKTNLKFKKVFFPQIYFLFIIAKGHYYPINYYTLNLFCAKWFVSKMHLSHWIFQWVWKYQQSSCHLQKQKQILLRSKYH